MSIYATELAFDADDHDVDCAVWVPAKPGVGGVDWDMATADGRHFRRDDSKPCTCKAGPVRYEASHILPSDDDLRSGSVTLCAIPGFIERTDRSLGGDDAPEGSVWPWLRLWVHDDHDPKEQRGSVVLLDRDQALKVYHYLGDWLMRAGGQP